MGKVLSELELDFDLEVIGFETAEIDGLIDGLETISEPDPDDRLPAIETSAYPSAATSGSTGYSAVIRSFLRTTTGYSTESRPIW